MYCILVLIHTVPAGMKKKKRIAAEKLVIRGSHAQDGESAASDGGRLKSQAAGVTRSGQHKPLPSHPPPPLSSIIDHILSSAQVDT